MVTRLAIHSRVPASDRGVLGYKPNPENLEQPIPKRLPPFPPIPVPSKIQPGGAKATHPDPRAWATRDGDMSSGGLGHRHGTHEDPPSQYGAQKGKGFAGFVMAEDFHYTVASPL
ncbi:hypothetical protein CSUB01_06704 [Colletotrichum sublineola]|uniref:Uncharacterized protein n=1 Tax=Colletotrichum sublineola TaxID=1173701 RepID=A0A066XML7_COLSU|nr:hypothetical protein CSUB01_06704 [Colletotrichum sublineola]